MTRERTRGGEERRGERRCCFFGCLVGLGESEGSAENCESGGESEGSRRET